MTSDSIEAYPYSEILYHSEASYWCEYDPEAIK